VTRPDLVTLNAVDAARWDLPDRLPAGAIVVGEGGDVLRILPSGAVELLIPSGYPRPGASHSTATRPAP